MFLRSVVGSAPLPHFFAPQSLTLDAPFYGGTKEFGSLKNKKKREKENSPPTIGIRLNFSRWGRWEVGGGEERGGGDALQRRVPSRQKHPPHACPWHCAAISAPLCTNLQRFPHVLPPKSAASSFWGGVLEVEGERWWWWGGESDRLFQARRQNAPPRRWLLGAFLPSKGHFLRVFLLLSGPNLC